METGLNAEPVDGSASWSEVDQREDQSPEFPIPSVPVEVHGPVQTFTLPSRTSVLRTLYVTAEPVELLAEDLRRARAIIGALGVFVVGLTVQDCRSAADNKPNGTQWNGAALGPLELRGTARVFVASPGATVDAPLAVGIVGESWAD